MAKKIDGYINLQVPAGRPIPRRRSAPRSASAACHHGVLQAVQRQEQGLEQGAPIPVKITVYLGPLLHLRDAHAAGVAPSQEGGEDHGGSKEPGRASAGTITMAQVREVREVKMKDLNTDDLEAAARTLAGSARSMGLQVVE
jgi:large subunit ribosomal protein L11